MPGSILEYFETKLPQIPKDGKPVPKMGGSKGGSGTVNAEAPRRWYDFEYKDYTYNEEGFNENSNPYKVARDVLEDPENAFLEDITAPEFLPSQTHYNEGDVSFSTEIYLIYPVLLVLKALNERARKPHVFLECQRLRDPHAVQKQGNKAVADFVFSIPYRDSEGKTKKRALVVLDVKRMERINKRELKDSRLNPGKPSDKNVLGGNVWPTDKNKDLEADHYRLMQQLTFYTETFKPMRAILFDWNTMFLSKFEDNRQGPSSLIERREFFCNVLLGCLLVAQDYHTSVEDDDEYLEPPQSSKK